LGGLSIVAKRVSAGAQTITGPTDVGMVVMVMMLAAARHDPARVAGDPEACQRVFLDKSTSTSAS
jgi:hypothetical protein